MDDSLNGLGDGGGVVASVRCRLAAGAFEEGASVSLTWARFIFLVDGASMLSAGLAGVRGENDGDDEAVDDDALLGDWRFARAAAARAASLTAWETGT